MLRFNQFSMLIFSSNAEFDRDWVVLLSLEPCAESEKVKKEERLGLRAEKGLTFSSLGLPPLFLAASPLVPSQVLSNYDLLDSKKKIKKIKK